MILILAGTADGRELARDIQAEGYRVLLSAATAYGQELAGETPARAGALDEAGFTGLISDEGIELVVDASHPFAANVSRTAISACELAGVPYVRFERPEVNVPENPLLYKVTSFPEAAEKAGALGDCIFLTTGSNKLELFVEAPSLRGKRLVARVLPLPDVIRKCLELGLKPADIAAMQGPFGVEMNLAMLIHYGAEVLVSKESGGLGGTDAKITAALELGIPVVLVQRPQIPYPRVVQDWAALRDYLLRHKESVVRSQESVVRMREAGKFLRA